MTEPTEPFPPRFYWLKRIVVISLILTCAYFGFWRWWKYVADRRMGAEVDRMHAAGERILVEDFAIEPVPDDENAGVSLNNAYNAAHFSNNDETFISYFNRNAEIDSATRDRLDRLLKKTAASRVWVRLARFQSKTNWNNSLTRPVYYTLLPTLGPQRELELLLAMDAISEHLSHHDAEAIEIIRDIFSHADRMQEYSPFIVSHLTALRMTGDGASVVQSVITDLEILSGDATTKPTGAASRAQIRALIDQLLEERPLRDGLTLSLEGERMQERDAGVSGGIFPFPPILELPAVRPMMVLDAVHLVRMTTQTTRAGLSPDYQTAKSMMPVTMKPSMTTLSSITLISRTFSQYMMPSLDRFMRIHYEDLAERRIAAIRLAIRLYQVDHRGEFPPALEDLSPNYLAKLPADPFRADGKTFGYVRTPLSNSPVLYSVGQDGVDDGGKVTVKAFDADDRNQWERKDVFFPLAKLAADDAAIYPR